MSQEKDVFDRSMAAGVFVIAGVFVGVLSVFLTGFVIEMPTPGKVFMFIFTTLAYIGHFLLSSWSHE